MPLKEKNLIFILFVDICSYIHEQMVTKEYMVCVWEHDLNKHFNKIGSIIYMIAKWTIYKLHSFSLDKNHIQDSTLYVFLMPNAILRIRLLPSMDTARNIDPKYVPCRWDLSMRIIGRTHV